MTVIVGLVHEGEVYLGGDRGATCVDNLTVYAVSQPKVWRYQHNRTSTTMVMGACDSFRMLQLLHHVMSPALPRTDIDPMAYMVKDFVPHLREVVERAGLPPDEDGPYLHGNVMVGFSGRLFVVRADFAVLEDARSYTAIGAGSAFAQGALWVSNERDPELRLQTAMSAAADHSFTVSEPFDVVSTRG